VVSTYTTFNQTYDEPFHIAAGMEWLDQGSYTYEVGHPPLARVAVALGPYLSGLRWPGSPLTYPDFQAVDDEILSAHGNYVRNLTLARIGILPFLMLACVGVFLWAHRWFGRVAAAFALFLFVCLPPVLGHAGLATTDMPVAATVATGLYMLVRWIEQPDWPRTGLLGLAFGAAAVSKFSAVAFLPPCAAAAVIYLAVVNRRVLFACSPRWQRHFFLRFLLATTVALVFVWSSYRFDMRPISPLHGAHREIDERLTNSWVRRAAYFVIETPLPVIDFYEGVRAVVVHNQFGHDAYLFQEYRKTGWWYFFLVVLAVKTPIGFLLLSATGVTAILLKGTPGSWQQRLTVAFPIVILLVCMTSRIDSGVRHILPIYPPLAVLGGYGVARLIQDARRWMAAGAWLLVASAAAESMLAHPDYMAYFNPIASNHPEDVLCDTDLDWGQDLFRLASRLRSLGVTHLTMKYYGTAPLDVAGLPSHKELSPVVPASGYVAISLRELALGNARDGSYDWLKRYQPVERVGRSILLFKIP
jgi:hypothetical protein